MKKIFFIILYILVNVSLVKGESLKITQIDSSTLLLNQNIKLYLNVTDNYGEPVKSLKEDMFEVYESADNKNFTKIDNIVEFDTMGNYESGINFLLLIDNSGSMYNTMRGGKTKNDSFRRITLAKNAVKNFLTSITNSKDKVGLAVYNTNYKAFTSPVADQVAVGQYLEDISRPAREDAYTEIYSSLSLAVNEFSAVKGRKVIIILSDGENMPYYKFTKKPHPVFDKKIYKYTEPIQSCQQEGISVFAINFGTRGGRKDKNLHKIALQTGGSTFDANNENELKAMYKTIVKQVINEYSITYKATMEPADKKYVKVVKTSGGKKIDTTRFYFSSSVFGMPLESFNPFLILPFLLAIGGLYALTRIKFEKEKAEPSIEILHTMVGAKVDTRSFTLNKGKTIIGSSPKADMTISSAGPIDLKDLHAAIIFDKKTRRYSLKGEGVVTVNNKKVQDKKLESGDVINVGGTTIVFDENDIKDKE